MSIKYYYKALTSICFIDQITFIIVVILLWYLACLTFEPVREKTNNLGFRPGLTQTGMYNHRRWLEAGNFVFK